MVKLGPNVSSISFPLRNNHFQVWHNSKILKRPLKNKQNILKKHETVNVKPGTKHFFHIIFFSLHIYKHFLYNCIHSYIHITETC